MLFHAQWFALLNESVSTPDNQQLSYAKRLTTSETNDHNYMIRDGQIYYETLSVFHYLICISALFLHVTLPLQPDLTTTAVVC